MCIELLEAYLGMILERDSRRPSPWWTPRWRSLRCCGDVSPRAQRKQGHISRLLIDRTACASDSWHSQNAIQDAGAVGAVYGGIRGWDLYKHGRSE